MTSTEFIQALRRELVASLPISLITKLSAITIIVEEKNPARPYEKRSHPHLRVVNPRNKRIYIWTEGEGVNAMDYGYDLGDHTPDLVVVKDTFHRCLLTVPIADPQMLDKIVKTTKTFLGC